MRTKEERKERKEAKTREWLHVFLCEYEIQRAYGNRPSIAAKRGLDLIKKLEQDDTRRSPSDRSFFIDCRVAFKSMVNAAVESAERGEPNV